jgi:LytS/YehU family sensor histidine kinase
LIVAYDKQLADLKMQFLRAQMNPHFMFNSLNSIKHFILTNEREKASEYLSNFAQLIRSILSFSNARYISLADELNTLETYVGLERIRFSDGFDYQIKVSESIDPSALLVQPLIFQPYVENAVWHGLMHKESQRRLEIEISENKNMLTCSITDNGIGREKSASIKSKSNTRKSLGLQISELRMKAQDANTTVEIIDLKSENGTSLGTRVLISLPLKYTQTKSDNHEDD